MIRIYCPCALLLLATALLAGTGQYSYDAAGRLNKVDYGDGRAITYTYDAASNLLKRDRTSAAPASFPTRSFLARRGNSSDAVAANEALFALPGSAVRLEWLGAKADNTVERLPYFSCLTGSDVAGETAAKKGMIGNPAPFLPARGVMPYLSNFFKWLLSTPRKGGN